MRIIECIDTVDGLKPNQYTKEDKLKWLSTLDANIHEDILKTHERNPDEEEIAEFIPYAVDDMEKVLIAPFPYDELYVAYLKMKIDEENGEIARYNNSAILFNSYMDNYAKFYNKHHRPISNKNFKMY